MKPLNDFLANITLRKIECFLYITRLNIHIKLNRRTERILNTRANMMKQSELSAVAHRSKD